MNLAEEHQLVTLYKESQINYVQRYLVLFSAYNLWFRATTGKTVDALAIQSLKQREDIWVASELGETLPQLRSVMIKLYVLTNHRPLNDEGRSWRGYLEDQYDWRGLIDFWYAVRCDLIHANSIQQRSYYPLLVKLAYDSLHIFMTEIIRRIRLCVTDADIAHTDVDQLSPESIRQYLISPEKNNVDAVSAKSFAELYELRENERIFRHDKPFTS